MQRRQTVPAPETNECEGECECEYECECECGHQSLTPRVPPPLCSLRPTELLQDVRRLRRGRRAETETEAAFLRKHLQASLSLSLSDASLFNWQKLSSLRACKAHAFLHLMLLSFVKALAKKRRIATSRAQAALLETEENTRVV